jgi:lamin tail-like protein
VNDVLRFVAQSLIRMRLAIAGVLGAAFCALALASVSLVSAQAAELRISELQCNSDPEVVTITNQGSAEQDLAGWTLRSDPVVSESFNLSVIGVLGAGVSVFVESGPGAQGSYVWSASFVLRDSDATDFARIVNANGAVVHEVKCQAGSPTITAQATAQPTATAAPTTARPTPTAAPATVSTNLVPDGGGPPGSGSWQSGGLMLVIGAWLLAAGFGIVVLARLRSGRAQPVIANMEALSPAILPEPATPGYARWLYLLGVLLLAAIASWSSGSDNRHPRR